MTFLEFAKIAANIKTYFPRDNILPTKEAMKLWFDGVADLDYEAVRIGLQKYSMTNSYPPSLSDLRSFAVHSHTDDPESETHAWNMVYKALGNSGQHAEEEFSKLPEVVQRAVHSPGQLPGPVPGEAAAFLSGGHGFPSSLCHFSV